MLKVQKMIRYRSAALILLVAVSLHSFAYGKDKKQPEPSPMVMFWPDQANPTLKLTFDKFTQMAAYNGQLSLGSNVLVENLSSKRIPQASFTVYLQDKDQVRVGNGTLNLGDLDAGQKEKLSFQVLSVGLPASLVLVARNDAAGVPTSVRTVPLKIASTPPGATLKVDGKDAGITPTTVRLGIGNHLLSFSKEGFASGTTPVEIKPDEGPGGSVSFELGGLSHDELHLRDGNVVQGDVTSLTMTSAVIRVDGKEQTYGRNQVDKIILVERMTTQETPVVQPVPTNPK